MKIIGVVMRLEELDGQKKWFINDSYMQALAPYHVAIFPICSLSSLDEAISICDGLLIPGGYDIHAFYLQSKVIETDQYYDSAMDHFDLCCIDAFVKANKAILGICRGMQLLAIYFQGTLLQHRDPQQHAQNNEHEIKLCEDSFLRRLYYGDTIVNSYHHQIVTSIGTDMMVSAITKQNEIEAIQHKTLPIIGVQWHPEKMQNDQVFAYFIDVLCSCKQ